MQLEHMTKLRDFCAKMDTQGAELDMNVWADFGSLFEIGPCRRGCVIGWALIHQVFKTEGLLADTPTWRPLYGRHTGREALERFFELSSEDVNRLFFPYHHPTREVTWQDKIASIDALVVAERTRRAHEEVRKLADLAAAAAQTAAGEQTERTKTAVLV